MNTHTLLHTGGERLTLLLRERETHTFTACWKGGGGGGGGGGRGRENSKTLFYKDCSLGFMYNYVYGVCIIMCMLCA